MSLAALLGPPSLASLLGRPPAAEPSLLDLLGPLTVPEANTYGGSGKAARGAWCTPQWLARLIGRVDLDPCSNERSHIEAVVRACGSGPESDDGLAIAKHVPRSWSVFINPPYSRGVVAQWISAYTHADYMFLLRWDPSTEWFGALIELNPWVWFATNRRIEFEPPPGVKGSSNPFPHAIFAKRLPNERLRANGRVFRLATGMG